MNYSEYNVGRFIGNVYVGALAYADDLVLLAPSARAMRLLLYICDGCGKKFSMKFNAVKSACLYVGKTKQRCVCVPQFSVGGYTLALSHLGLGHIISDNFDDKSEILSKRNSLCSNINNVLCYFYKQNPVGAYKKSYPGYSGTHLRPHSTSLPSKLGFVTPCQKCTADCLRPNGTRHNGSLY